MQSRIPSRISQRASIASALCGIMLCTGCAAHKAKHFTAPDASTLNGKRAEAATLVRSVRTKVARASEQFAAASPKLREATESRAKETAIVDQLAPKLAELRLRVTAELRPEVDAAIAQVEDLKFQSAITGDALGDGWKRIEAGRTDLTDATAQLQRTDTVLGEIASKYGPAYDKEVAALVEKANAAENGWATASAEAQTLRNQSLLHKVLTGLGALALIALGFLWLTGRIAAKIA